MGRGPLRWRRRTWLAGASARRDMTCRDRQWAKTQMRPYTALLNMTLLQGIRIPATAYKKESNESCSTRANTEPRLCVLLCPVSPSPDLAVLAFSLGELTANVLLLLKTVISQSREQHRSAASVSDRSTRVQSQSGYLCPDTQSVTSLNHQNVCQCCQQADDQWLDC